jgi:hypothetical protein
MASPPGTLKRQLQNGSGATAHEPFLPRPRPAEVSPETPGQTSAISKSVGDPHDLLKGPVPSDKLWEGEPSSWKPAPSSSRADVGHDGAGQEKLKLPSQRQRLGEGDVPPSKPASKHFRLRLPNFTTSTDAEPCILGNFILDHLESGACEILEVNRQEFSIRARVFSDGSMVELKAQFYKLEEANNYVVEFQRHHGCCLRFNNVVQDAMDFLKSKGFDCQREVPKLPEVNLTVLSMDTLSFPGMPPMFPATGELTYVDPRGLDWALGSEGIVR